MVVLSMVTKMINRDSPWAFFFFVSKIDQFSELIWAYFCFINFPTPPPPQANQAVAHPHAPRVPRVPSPPDQWRSARIVPSARKRPTCNLLGGIMGVVVKASFRFSLDKSLKTIDIFPN